MSFETPTRNGTRGRRQPVSGGPVGRWIAKRVINRIRRKGKMPGLGFNALVLTTIGRKSGVERQTPVGWFPGPDGSWLIVPRRLGRPGIRRGTTTWSPIPTRSGSRCPAARSL